MLPLQDVTHVTKDVSSKTAVRSRDISAWRSVQGGDLEEYTDSAALLPPALHLGPCTGPVHRDQGAGFTALISGGGRNTVEKNWRGQCGAVAFQSGGRVGKLLGDKST